MKKLTTILALLGLSLGAPAFADDEKKSGEDDMKSHIEMHEKMAKAHSEAAECLKSGKSRDECKEKFKEACGKEGKGCMMGHHGKHKGHGKGKDKKKDSH